MEEWRQSSWGSEITLEYEKAIRGYQEAIAPYRVYGTNGPVGWAEKPLAPGPGVILGRKGAYRGVNFSRDPFFVIDTAYYVKPKHDLLDMRWLYYAIIHHKLGEIDDGSPIPSTTRAAVYVRDFDVPPLSEQRAIAATLGALDDKIELNRRMCETLESMARALFRDWFVDFGPTRAKMAGTAPYLAADLWSLFPDRLNEEGKPEGWEVLGLGDVAKNHSETMDLKKRQKVIFVNTGDVSQGIFLHSNYSDAKGLPGQAKKKIEVGDILYSEIRPKNRRYAFVNFDAPDHLVSTKFMVLRTISAVSPIHLYFLVSSSEAVEEFNTVAESRSGTFPQITFDSIKHFPVTLANDEIMKAFSEILESIFKLRWESERENEALAETRDLLLPRLMSGELRVADAESLLERVL